MSRKELTTDKDRACKTILLRMPNSGVSGNTKLEQKSGITAGVGSPLLHLPLCPHARQTSCSLPTFFSFLTKDKQQWRWPLVKTANEPGQGTKALKQHPLWFSGPCSQLTVRADNRLHVLCFYDDPWHWASETPTRSSSMGNSMG